MTPVQVGVAVVVWNFTQRFILVGQRIGSHQAGKWCFPGGRVEPRESLVVAARREVLEETGALVGAIKPLALANNWMADIESQFLTVYLETRLLAGQTPKLMEPTKCTGWAWCDPFKVPQPHMTPLSNLRAMGLDGVPVEDVLEMTPESIDFHAVSEGWSK